MAPDGIKGSSPAEAKLSHADALAREIAARLKTMREGPEDSHREADQLVLDFVRQIGHANVAEAFEECRRKNGFWYA